MSFAEANGRAAGVSAGRRHEQESTNVEVLWRLFFNGGLRNVLTVQREVCCFFRRSRATVNGACSLSIICLVDRTWCSSIVGLIE